MRSLLNPRYVYGSLNEFAQRLIEWNGWSHKWWRPLLLVFSAVFYWICISIPLDLGWQALFSTMVFSLAMYLRRYAGTLVTLVMMMFSICASSRYLYWRVMYTIDYSGGIVDVSFGMLLLLAELYAWLVLLLGYMQTAWPLRRKPIEMPADIALWPTVDIYIPTYNEPLSVVKTTVLAALSVDWPKDKLAIYILDDQRREIFREFAEAVGVTHITRPDNKHAKAGNINAALPKTKGEYIAIFDCDHIPTRSFLQSTMGWFLHDPKLAMMQTPHHFLSPDPFERNLDNFRHVPNEGELFYGLIQDGNDLWNATFFCGSCAVLRRTMLEEVGGVAVETVTEDAHTALKMQRRGYNTAYLSVPQAAGLATESLSAHVGQRIRWARGMAQIFRVDNPMLGKGLSFGQRLCYSNAMLHFFYGLPRMVFLLSPLSYMFFQAHIIQASAVTIAAYSIPHLLHSNLTNSRIQGQHRHSFWAEVYEATLAWYIFRPTLVALINPKFGSFNVTAKGGLVEKEHFDWSISRPYLIMLALNIVGLFVGIIRLFWWNTFEMDTVILNLLWTLYNLVILGATLSVATESRQVRKTHRVRTKLKAAMRLPDGHSVICATEDFSMGGMSLRMPAIFPIENGMNVQVSLFGSSREFVFPGKVVSVRNHLVSLAYPDLTLEQEINLVRCTMGRADAWISWSEDPVMDHPLVGFKEIFVHSIQGFMKFGSGGIYSAFKSFKSRSQHQREEKKSADMIRAEEKRANKNQARKVSATPADTVPLTGTKAHGLGPSGSFLSFFKSKPKPTVADRESPELKTTNKSPSKFLWWRKDTVASWLMLCFLTGAMAALSLTISGNAMAQTDPEPIKPTTAEPPLAPGQSKKIILTLEQLGALKEVEIRGVSGEVGFPFTVRSNEVITSALLKFGYAYSPSLLPDLSHLKVLVNGELVATAPMPREGFNGMVKEVPIDPRVFLDFNQLGFKMIGHYTRDCEDPFHSSLWSRISNTSQLELTVSALSLQNDLAMLPGPFFDKRDTRQVSIPFVFGAAPSPATLKSAGVVASWFGHLSGYRGVRFPVSNNSIPGENSIVFATQDEMPSGVTIPAITGPTLLMMANPVNPDAKLLLVMGRTQAELKIAVQALTLGQVALSGERAVITQINDVVARKPYDAPKWIPTDRAVRFGELSQLSDLQVNGLMPDVIRVKFRISPDLFAWRSAGVPIDLKYRFTPQIKQDKSSLNIGINGEFIKSLSLSNAQNDDTKRTASFNLFKATTASSTAKDVVVIPSFQVTGENELQFHYFYDYAKQGACKDVLLDNYQSAVDPDSTVDFSALPHYAILPNLSFVANAGFPFTRMADLSDTVVVMPDHPNPQELEAYLVMMGRMGESTGYPVLNVELVKSADTAAMSGKDILVIGMNGDNALLHQWAGYLPLSLDNGVSKLQLPTSISHLLMRWGDHDAELALRRAGEMLASGGNNIGAMMQIESPLSSGHSVILLTAGTSDYLLKTAIGMLDPELRKKYQGDLVLVKDNLVESLSVGETYYSGHLPIMTSVRWHLANQPLLLVVLLVIASVIAAVILFRLLRRRAAVRLGSK